MIIGAIFLPTALADLLSLISKKSSFDSRFRPRLGIKHVVLMGQLDFKTVKEFLVELFHPDHGKLSSTIRLVILNPSEPNDDIKSLLTDHPFSSRIQYVKGQEISFHSLNKIVFHQASACFILSSKYGADDRDPRIIDAETVMRVLSLKKYDSAVPLYVQVQLPSNRIHFRHLAEHVVCVEEIKLGLLAANVVAPGFATIIYLLTTSSVSASGSNGGGGDTGSRVNWQEEYLHSASQEIYPVTFGAAFAGVPFWKAAKLIYGKFKAILFAVSLATTPSGFRKILINPSFHHIKNKDVGFIIASDSSVAESVERSWLRLEESEIEEDWMDVVNTLDFQDHSIMNLQRTQPLNVIVAPQAGSSSSSLSGFGSKNGSPMGSLRESLVLMSGGSGSNKGSKIHQSTIVKLSPPLARNALLKGKVKETPKHTSFVVGEDAVQGEEEMDESNLSTPRPSALSKAVTVLSLQNHLLICDFSHEEFPSAILYHLVAPLKARQPDLAIVILCPSSPSSQDQQQILLLNQTSSSSSATTSYSNVFTVQGSPLDRVDLDRANVQSASHVVVLSSSRMESGSFQTADSGQLVAVLNIESLNKLVDLFITVDLQHAENMRFIGGKKSITTIGNDNKIIPAFAAGHVFSHSMLNSILAQTYYNPSFLDILTRLLLIEEGDDHQEVQNHTPKEFRSVQHLSVPHRFVGCTYGQWVDFLLHHKQIPLGLYRQCLVEFNHYALVNPRNETILNVHDRAYVLRSGI